MRRPDYWKGPYLETRDCWIGMYIDRGWMPNEIARRVTHVYICLVPCFPIRLTWATPE